MSLSYEDRMKILVEESNKTMADIYYKLSVHGRCMCVRPTGFGKTYLLVKLAFKYIEKFPNKKVMYVIPNDIIETEIRNNKEYDQDLINQYFEFVNYQGLAKSVGDSGTVKARERYLSCLDNCSICLLDEVHRAAADGYSLFYNFTESYYSVDKVHLVGATATPNRSNEKESEWLFDELFKGVRTYDYTLYDAIVSGLLLKPIYCMTRFKSDKMLEDYRRRIEALHLRVNGYFNKRDFESMLNRIYRSDGSEPKTIYKNLKKAGYNLVSDNPDDSYIKFIVFFKNVEELIRDGEETEQWFFDAIEKEASKDFDVNIKFEKHVDYVISSTADENNNFAVQTHVAKKAYRNCIYNASDVGKNDEYKGHRIDLIFNVNVITMGYHVDHISGVMLRRNVGTEIMYYQQLGRCFSVKATRPSIIFDLFYNKTLQKNRDKRKMFIQNIFTQSSYNVSTKSGIERLPKESNEQFTEDMFVDGYEDGMDDLLGLWENPDFSYISRIRYLYEDRNMPIALIAQDTNLSCIKVASYLIEMGIDLKKETPMYEFLNVEDNLSDTSSNEFKLLRFLYSKKAYSHFIKAKEGAKRGILSLYKVIVSLLSGGNKNE